MCFWYQIRRPSGTDPVSIAATLRQSVSCAAITAARPGWSSPVASR